MTVECPDYAIQDEVHVDPARTALIVIDSVVRRYGLNGSSVQSHQEIARGLGVGEERSRQLEHESLHRLRSVSGPLARVA